MNEITTLDRAIPYRTSHCIDERFRQITNDILLYNKVDTCPDARGTSFFQSLLLDNEASTDKEARR